MRKPSPTRASRNAVSAFFRISSCESLGLVMIPPGWTLICYRGRSAPTHLQLRPEARAAQLAKESPRSPSTMLSFTTPWFVAEERKATTRSPACSFPPATTVVAYQRTLRAFEPGEVLADECVRVETEEGRVAAQERSRVATGRELLEPVFFERAQVALTHLRLTGRVSKLESASFTRLTQGCTYLEHAAPYSTLDTPSVPDTNVPARDQIAHRPRIKRTSVY